MSRTQLLASALVTLFAACSGGGGTGGTPPVTEQSGSVTGKVTASGSGVGGAQVSLPGAATQTTNAAGQFTFENVAAGSYTLTVALPAGYALATGEATTKPATITNGQTATVNWTVSRTSPVETRDVDLQASSFSPSDVTVTRGSTIHWVNRTATTHTITPSEAGQAGIWAAQNISGVGTDFSHTFSTAGTYDYHCTIHAGMSGTIRVQ